MGKYSPDCFVSKHKPKGKEDNTTFDKLKAQLIAVGIPEEQPANQNQNCQ